MDWEDTDYMAYKTQIDLKCVTYASHLCALN